MLPENRDDNNITVSSLPYGPLLQPALQGLELLVAPAIFVFNYKRMPKDFNHLPASRDSNELRSDGFQMSRTYGARFLYLQILLGSHEEHGQPLPQHGMSLGHF